ncbi:MAG: nucleotide exchange factor GrpE, partial [Parcubacteria group bacterium CG_4_9_14_0_2_um_filter_35_11]
ENLSQWIKGILGIKNQIKNLLEKERVKEIDTKRKFNPAFHEVVETVAGEDGQIMEVVQKGYLLEGEVLRFAKVKIGKKTENNNSMSSM